MAKLFTRQFSNTSSVASHPSVTVTVEQGYKLVGGGAIIDPVEPSNFLTASYPVSPVSWYAEGKDHEIISPASITAFAIGLYDPDDIWDVQFVAQNSAVLSQPKAAVGLTDDYVLTGGGAIVNYTGAGNMLNASFPSPNPNGDGDWYIWNAHSKDHDISDPASITVYAIGIRLRGAPVNSPGVRSFIIAQTTPPTDKPQIKTDTMGTTPGDACLSGGGAWDEWSGAGNMLTASGPTRDNDWFARGSDHITASPALPLGRYIWKPLMRRNRRAQGVGPGKLFFRMSLTTGRAGPSRQAKPLGDKPIKRIRQHTLL